MNSFLGVALLLMCSPSALLDFAAPIWKSEPAMRIEDAYKWIFQATRGGEHAIPDTASAKKWLDSEWSVAAKPLQGESLWTPLCPDGSIGRLHIRKFKAADGNEDDILRAFLNSANRFENKPEIFISTWLEFGKRLKQAHLGKLTYKHWKKLNEKMKAENYPAIHHSKAYEKAFRPSYRIMTGQDARAIASF